MATKTEKAKPNPNPNGKKQIDAAVAADQSIQARALAKDVHGGASNYTFWFVRDEDDCGISDWWSPQRDIELEAFLWRRNNDILQGAVSSMTKKFKAMNWVVEGPERVVNKYLPILSDADFGGGWSFLLGKTLIDYFGQDRGAFWEIIGGGNPDGPINGPVNGIAHLDAQQCQLTGDLVYPVIYHNTKFGTSHKLHATRVSHMVDMPSPRHAMNNIGFCGVSRVIGSSSILLKLNQYKNEKLSDLPEAGMLLLNNILPQQWDDVTQNVQRGKRKQGHQYWQNIMVFMGLDPAQPATADFISFANLPDVFDEQQAVNTYVNILALAFGVDVREFWPITGGALGTATESQVMHQKARGKGVGEVISMIERVINWKVLPEALNFRFDFQDDEEDQLRAEIQRVKTQTIMEMWKPPTQQQAEQGVTMPVNIPEIRQMLADNVDYFNDDFLLVDISENTTATDTDQEVKLYKQFGPKVAIDRDGKRRRLNRFGVKAKANVDLVLDMVEENYKAGLISRDDYLEFNLGAMLDKRES